MPLSDSPTTPTRRHYPGRPLPRPPPVVPRMVDSTYAPHQDSPVDDDISHDQVPEGLLIDLGDTPPITESPTTSVMPAIIPPQPLHELLFASLNRPHFGTTSSNESVIESQDSHTDVLASSYSLLAPDITSDPRSPPDTFSQFTDLDALVARLENDNHDGSDYDVSYFFLLCLSL